MANGYGRIVGPPLPGADVRRPPNASPASNGRREVSIGFAVTWREAVFTFRIEVVDPGGRAAGNLTGPFAQGAVRAIGSSLSWAR